MSDQKWNSFPHLTSAELDDADGLPVSDASQAVGSRDATTTIEELKALFGGAEGFTDLSDVPSSYAGHGGKLVAVTSGEDGLEFVAGGGGSTVDINAQTGTTYTLVLGDAGKLVTLTNGSAITLTVPTNASVAFPVGTVVALAQLGAGLVTIEGASGVTINGTTPGDEELAGQWATASLTKIATDTWLLSGGVA